jgi:hypothetical protein
MSPKCIFFRERNYKINLIFLLTIKKLLVSFVLSLSLVCFLALNENRCFYLMDERRATSLNTRKSVVDNSPTTVGQSGSVRSKTQKLGIPSLVSPVTTALGLLTAVAPPWNGISETPIISGLPGPVKSATDSPNSADDMKAN